MTHELDTEMKVDSEPKPEQEPPPQTQRPEVPLRDIKRLRAKGELIRAWLAQLIEQRGERPYIGPRDVQALELMERVMLSVNSGNHDFAEGESIGSFFR